MASASAEIAAAYAARNRLVDLLTARGWPLPLLGLSGNGYHAQYRCRLPNNAETAAMLKATYAGLAAEIDDKAVRLDVSVRNPGRIFRLYGTLNRKGPDTPERPHRRSACLIPDPWDKVDVRHVARLADSYAKSGAPTISSLGTGGRSGPVAWRPRGSGDYRTLDVVAWFAAHGAYRHPLEGNVHSVWCPWQDGHSTPHGRSGALVFEDGEGPWPGFFCHHASCAGRTVRDAMALWGDVDAFCLAAYSGGPPRRVGRPCEPRRPATAFLGRQGSLPGAAPGGPPRRRSPRPLLSS